jgi:hypothetical protein
MTNSSIKTIQDIFKAFTDRIGNPFLFSFSISYFFYHLDAILYLYLSKKDAAERISEFYKMLDIIPTELTSFYWENWGSPFVVALFYTVFWSHISTAMKLLPIHSEKWFRDKFKAIDPDYLPNPEHFQEVKERMDEHENTIELIKKQKRELQLELESAESMIQKLVKEKADQIKLTNNIKGNFYNEVKKLHGFNDDLKSFIEGNFPPDINISTDKEFEHRYIIERSSYILDLFHQMIGLLNTLDFDAEPENILESFSEVQENPDKGFNRFNSVMP